MVNNLTPNLLKRLILKLESVICCFWWKTLVSHFIITYVTKRNISCLAVGSTSSKCLLVSWILFVTLVFLNHWIIIRAFFLEHLKVWWWSWNKDERFMTKSATKLTITAATFTVSWNRMNFWMFLWTHLPINYHGINKYWHYYMYKHLIFFLNHFVGRMLISKPQVKCQVGKMSKCNGVIFFSSTW